jgi:serine/threonine protein kinase
VQIDISDKVGEGAYAVVYAGKKETNDVVCKFQLLDVPIPSLDCQSSNDYELGNCRTKSKEEFDEEIETAKFCESLGISPKVYYTDIYDAIDYAPPSVLKNPLMQIPKYIGVIVIERYGISLAKYAKANFDGFLDNEMNLIKQYLDILSTLYDNGYDSFDNHFGNIVIDPSTLKMKFIDVEIDIGRTKPKLYRSRSWTEAKMSQLKRWNHEVSSLKSWNRGIEVSKVKLKSWKHDDV